MNYAVYLRAQILADVQNIRRDPMLKWFVIIPIIMALILKVLIQIVEVNLAGQDFDLSQYYDLILGLYLILLVPMLYGVIIGFMLLDERDEQTLLALQVTPLSIERYMLYRVVTPMLVSLPMLVLSVILTDIASIGFFDLLLVSILASLWAPFLGLLLPVFAGNKVEGFALMKALGGLFVLPIAAFFVPRPFDLLFGIFPSYWPVKAFWEASKGEPYLIFLIGGIFFTVVPLYFIVRRLQSKVFD